MNARRYRWLLTLCGAWGWGAACGPASSTLPTSTPGAQQPPGSASGMSTGDWAAKAVNKDSKPQEKDGPALGAPEWTSTSGFDPKAWMAAHHVNAPAPKDAQCEAAQVGAPPTDALSCDERIEIQVAKPNAGEAEYVPPEVMFRRVLYVPAGGGLRKVLDIPIEVGPLNPVTKDPDANAYARLQVELDSTGVKLTVSDDPNFSCDHAQKKQAELAADKDTAETAKRLKKAVEPVCAARGEYQWRNGSFQRVAAKKK